jgi:hypothetical protein
MGSEGTRARGRLDPVKTLDPANHVSGGSALLLLQPRCAPFPANGGCVLPFAAVEPPRLESQRAVVALQGPAQTKPQGPGLVSARATTEAQPIAAPWS